MSIAANIERISSAKQDIITAIRSKGVEVPDTVMIEELAAYIAMIPQNSQSSEVTVTDDGNGNLVISGATITDDGNGNLTMSGVNATDNDGNVTIGG